MDYVPVTAFRNRVQKRTANSLGPLTLTLPHTDTCWAPGHAVHFYLQSLSSHRGWAIFSSSNRGIPCGKCPPALLPLILTSPKWPLCLFSKRTDCSTCSSHTGVWGLVSLSCPTEALRQEQGPSWGTGLCFRLSLPAARWHVCVHISVGVCPRTHV